MANYKATKFVPLITSVTIKGANAQSSTNNQTTFNYAGKVFRKKLYIQSK